MMVSLDSDSSTFELEPASLKAQLAPLEFPEQGQCAIPHEPPDIAHYCSFYGIDLEHQYPDITHSIGTVKSYGYDIACHYYQQKNAKGSFFLIHGYYDHVGFYSNILRFLIEQGYSVLAYDLPGHGLSSGKSGTIPDFSIYTLILEDLLKVSTDKLPEPWHAYGQSTGCAILTDCLIQRATKQQSSPFKQVILSAPLIRPWLWKLGSHSITGCSLVY